MTRQIDEDWRREGGGHWRETEREKMSEGVEREKEQDRERT